jgi:hypothetical protein
MGKRQRKLSPREKFHQDFREFARQCEELGVKELIPADGRRVVLAARRIGGQVFVLEAQRKVKAKAKRKKRIKRK